MGHYYNSDGSQSYNLTPWNSYFHDSSGSTRCHEGYDAFHCHDTGYVAGSTRIYSAHNNSYPFDPHVYSWFSWLETHYAIQIRGVPSYLQNHMTISLWIYHGKGGHGEYFAPFDQGINVENKATDVKWTSEDMDKNQNGSEMKSSKNQHFYKLVIKIDGDTCWAFEGRIEGYAASDSGTLIRSSKYYYNNSNYY